MPPALSQVPATAVAPVLHVPDVENYTDFLTKWVPAKKLRASLDYVTGRRLKKPAN